MLCTSLSQTREPSAVLKQNCIRKLKLFVEQITISRITKLDIQIKFNQ